jgi:hypothetical protein
METIRELYEQCKLKDPLVWKLDRVIGAGGHATVFLEQVQHGISTPQLWAVKRISKSLPGFPALRYMRKIVTSAKPGKVLPHSQRSLSLVFVLTHKSMETS